MKTFAVAVAFSLGLISSASAADLAARPYTKAPAPIVPSYNWTGFYIGGAIGGAGMNNRFDFADEGHYNIAPGDSLSLSDGGSFAGGGQIGYNWQFAPNWVFGLEGSVIAAKLRADAISPFFPESDTFHTRADWIATITPRLGYTTGQWMYYVKGGVAFSEIKTVVQDDSDYNPRKSTRTGWTAGGGIEYMLTPNWIIGAEGNYYDFGRCCGGLQESFDTGTTTPAGVSSNHSIRTDMWSGLLRLSYKFGGPVY